MPFRNHSQPRRGGPLTSRRRPQGKPPEWIKKFSLPSKADSPRRRSKAMYRGDPERVACVNAQKRPGPPRPTEIAAACCPSLDKFQLLSAIVGVDAERAR